MKKEPVTWSGPGFMVTNPFFTGIEVFITSCTHSGELNVTNSDF